jgi:D-beta-D-heptose 7-phosphate kinase/D-beta-D-heptose 1-phosphate adenosyltransferase
LIIATNEHIHYLSLEKAKSIISSFSDRTLLVLGDLMIDEYLWGIVDRISPEAPVQVVDVQNRSYVLGGAGNVVNNLVSLGAKVFVSGVIGQDRNGELLQGELKRLGVKIDGLFVDNIRRTTKKTRIVADGQQVLRIDWETKRDIPPGLEEKIITYVGDTVSRYDAVLISDYGKGVLTGWVLQEVIVACRTQRKRVLVDPKGKEFGKYRGASIITANRKEAAIASGIAIDNEDTLVRVGQGFLKDLELEAALITRGKEGMSLFVHDQSPIHIPAHVREVYDVSGAGDTVLALLGLGTASYLSWLEASYLANMAAGIVVGKIGTASISGDELVDLLATRTPTPRIKIKDLQELKHIVGYLKAKGKSIVFTNGCFDLLHVGHIDLLRKSRAIGDVLIVALDSDESVRKLKGNQRPIISQEERAHILAALDCVDYVTIFPVNSLRDLLRELRPNILTKGSNYRKEEVVGGEILESYGGQVALIPITEGISTSGIISDILKEH